MSGRCSSSPSAMSSTTLENLECSYIDLCRYGLADYATGEPHKKPTRILNASRLKGNL